MNILPIHCQWEWAFPVSKLSNFSSYTLSYKTFKLFQLKNLQTFPVTEPSNFSSYKTVKIFQLYTELQTFKLFQWQNLQTFPITKPFKLFELQNLHTFQFQDPQTFPITRPFKLFQLQNLSNFSSYKAFKLFQVYAELERNNWKGKNWNQWSQIMMYRPCTVHACIQSSKYVIGYMYLCSWRCYSVHSLLVWSKGRGLMEGRETRKELWRKGLP